MSKKRCVVLNYNGQRIVLDTIAGYCGVYKDDRSTTTKHGVRFDLRTGETIEHMGNDEVSRNKVLKFLDDHFKPESFTANKCQVCAHKEDNRNNDCFSKHNNCSDFRGYSSFEREKDDLDKLSN